MTRLSFTGDTVYVHGAAATPIPLLESLAAWGKEGQLKDVKLYHIHTEGPGICQQPEYEGIKKASLQTEFTFRVLIIIIIIIIIGIL